MQQDLIRSHQVDIIILDCTLEAIAIGAVLESMNILVRRHFVGNAKKLVDLLSHPQDLYPIVIICCHGTKQGIILPELAPEIDQQMPYHQFINAHDLNDFLKLDHKLIINTGCCLGQEEFATSFLKAGAQAYIASEHYINGNDSVIFVINFMYYHLARKLAMNDAFILSNKLIDPTCKFRLMMKQSSIFSNYL